MQPSPISRNADILRLIDEGFEAEVRAGLLLIHHVPFVTREKTVAYGILVSELTLAGDVTVRPGTHVAQFAGGIPCDEHGAPLGKIINSIGRNTVADGLTVECSFSSRPPEGYADYYEKMTTYAAIISAPANALDPSSTARTFRVREAEASDSPFRYQDTATARAGIALINSRLAVSRVAVVGLGGTGAFVLDLLSKCPIREIHGFDGKRLLQHNVFRAPGAVPIEKLAEAPFKADYYAAVYCQLHTGVVGHAYNIDEFNVGELAEMDFVFIAVDSSPARGLIVAELLRLAVPFIDVGMGILEADGKLTGTLRTTMGGADERLFPTSDASLPNEYSTNIQIADLNARNAVEAVIMWKRYLGFYVDLDRPRSSLFHIEDNTTLNGDFRCDD